MEQALYNLATAKVDMFQGIGVVYYDASGKRTVLRENVFEGAQAAMVPAFIFEVDTDLLADRLLSWHSATIYGMKNIFHANRQLVEKLRPVVQQVYGMIDRLKRRDITCEAAGEISELLSIEFMRIKPSQDKYKAFLTWFKMNDLIDQYRERYSRLSSTEHSPLSFYNMYPNYKKAA